MKQLLNKICLHLLFLATLTTILFLPVVKQTSIAPPDFYYPKVNKILGDYYFYISSIQQGRIYFQEYDLYTTENTNPNRLVHPYYLLLGQIGKYTGISDVDMYWTGLYAAFILMYIYAFLLVSLFFSGKYRWIALFLIFFAGPFPAVTLSFFGNSFPLGTSWWTYMDIYSRLTAMPHHLIGQALMVSAVYYLLRFLDRKKYRYAVFCAAASTFGVFLYPLPIIYFLVGCAATVFLICIKNIKSGLGKLFRLNKRYIFPLSIIFAFPIFSVVLVYQNMVSAGFPWSIMVFWDAKLWNTPKEFYPYTLTVLLLSYGILPVLAGIGLFVRRKKMRFKDLFLVCLLAVPLFFYYLASRNLIMMMKIRCPHGAPYVFGGLLATYGIQRLLALGKTKTVKRIICIVLALILSANAVSGLISYWLPEVNIQRFNSNVYLSKNRMEAISYINKTIPPFSNFMVHYYEGVYLPAFTIQRVYIGLEGGTLNFTDKWLMAERFFNGSLTQYEIKRLFDTNRLEYVYWDKGVFPLQYKNMFRPIFQNDEIAIYRYL